MALKPVYVIDGRRWLPIGRAAELLATGTATVKRMMGDGRLEWHQVPRGRTLLVEEAGVLRQRLLRGAGDRETARRTLAATRTAAERGRSMRDRPPATVRAPVAGGAGVFEPTWDPRSSETAAADRLRPEDGDA